MTISLSGLIKLNGNINAEFQLGNVLSAYRNIRYYKPSITTLGNFSTTNLNFGQFRGTQASVTVNITISSINASYTLDPSKVTGYVASFTTVNLTIASGVYLGSNDTSTYALTITGFTTGDAINLINNGIIIGAGGNGGNGTGGAGNAGSPGGNAILLQFPTNITNNGTIAGGGGGGGAGDGGRTYGSCLGGGSDFNGGGGGGGAGYIPGNGGSGDPSGNGGSRTAGGAASGGGAGGGPGLAGATSGPGRAGGAAGKYITGLSFANFIVNGTRLGGST
jgi:hypothetical protein